MLTLWRSALSSSGQFSIFLFINHSSPHWLLLIVMFMLRLDVALLLIPLRQGFKGGDGSVRLCPSGRVVRPDVLSNSDPRVVHSVTPSDPELTAGVGGW